MMQVTESFNLMHTKRDGLNSNEFELSISSYSLRTSAVAHHIANENIFIVTLDYLKLIKETRLGKCLHEEK